MSSATTILLVALLCGVACSLSGVFLVLRRLAMMADAISHSILPGLVAGYFLAQGPNLLAGFIGAIAAALLTVYLVEFLTKKRSVKEDSAIGLVFPTLFALGVFVVTKYFSNVHVDADAVLYGEISLAPFDTWKLGTFSMGAKSLSVMSALILLNLVFIKLFYKELKATTFDPGFSIVIGIKSTLLSYMLMTCVAVTTVGAFSAVGAILTVALIIIPATTASLISDHLKIRILLCPVIGALAGLLGYLLANQYNVSISGMIATTLGAIFFLTLLFSPKKGVLPSWQKQRHLMREFSMDMLLMHLKSHENTAREEVENVFQHLSEELRWTREAARRIVSDATQKGWVSESSGRLAITPSGRSRVAEIDRY